MKRPFALAGAPQSMMLIPLAPVLAVQAWRTVRRTPRLDPAGGDEHGFLQGANPVAGPAFRVLVLGESTAVGVGASRHAEALPGFLAEALCERTRRSVAWSVSGENGATARRITRLTGGLVPPGSGAAPDLVVVTAGINDLIRRRSLRGWARDMTELVGVLRGRYAHATVLVAGMPPVHRFPALPQPLRYVLGARARTMDAIARKAAEAGGAVHAPMDEAMARDRALFASDGFHPSPAGYRAWAQDLARAATPPALRRAPGAPAPDPPAPDLPAPGPPATDPPAPGPQATDSPASGPLAPEPPAPEPPATERTSTPPAGTAPPRKT